VFFLTLVRIGYFFTRFVSKKVPCFLVVRVSAHVPEPQGVDERLDLLSMVKLNVKCDSHNHLY
jgi:hypothetical protein